MSNKEKLSLYESEKEKYNEEKGKSKTSQTPPLIQVKKETVESENLLPWETKTESKPYKV